MHPLLELSRYAARIHNGTWCYCEMGHDTYGVYGIVREIAAGFASREEVYEIAKLNHKAM